MPDGVHLRVVVQALDIVGDQLCDGLRIADSGAAMLGIWKTEQRPLEPLTVYDPIFDDSFMKHDARAELFFHFIISNNARTSSGNHPDWLRHLSAAKVPRVYHANRRPGVPMVDGASLRRELFRLPF